MSVRAHDEVLAHLRAARDHADLHFAEPIDVDRLAAVARLSRWHFQRLFAATYGVPPAAYLSRRRIERAQDLLRASNLSVTEVCHAVGFTSPVTPEPAHRASRRATSSCGVSPREHTRRSRTAPWARSVVAMITNVNLVSVWVKDQDASLAFYTDVLGFELREDVRLAEDFRWLTVGHPSQPELFLHLTTPGPPLSEDLQREIHRSLDAGGMPGVGIEVDDCRATHADLAAKGVTFLQEPAERPYGVEALFRDNSGNWIVMVEPQEFDPEAMTVADLER